MNKKHFYFFFSLLMLSFVFAFTHENPYFRITKKDVKIRIPKEFSAPVYDFSKNPITPAGFVLGRKLFYDPILSRDSSTSCGSCHQRIAAFGHIDHRLSHGINGLIGTRNVPAIQNIIWQPNFMWDGGINHLDLQPIAPITSPVEMDETMAHLLEKLQKHSEYPKLFKKAFKKETIESADLLKALSQFVALMVSDSSKYDRYVRGEIAFSTEEENGLKLFRKHCNNCHKEPLFSDFSFRNIGLAPDTALQDYGRLRITGLKSDSMKFRVPSLRNVEITYPYMHDGRFQKLEQVLNHYAKSNFFTQNVDEAVRENVGLTQEERTALIAFLKTLTDRSYTYDRRFIDPNPPSY
jgi:cytochrome c peroxidase